MTEPSASRGPFSHSQAFLRCRHSLDLAAGSVCRRVESRRAWLGQDHARHAGQAEVLARSGFDGGVPLSIFLTVIEFGGGICIALGLFTRFWAAAIAIEMGVLTFYLYWGHGFSWLNRGYEYTLMWGIVALAIALRGGGPYSLDRMLGREL